MIEIRRLNELAEFREAVALQKEIWRFDDIDLLPVRLFVVSNKVGGHSFGAFDNGRMVAFLLAIPGLHGLNSTPTVKGYLHSHMLGVLTSHRNAGLGRALKLAQRDDAIARGIDLVEWTFDPLEIKNAFFNIERLGAIVRRYSLNQYGVTSSTLHGALPTDRCIAEWWVQSRRVQSILDGTATERPLIEATISVPAEIATLRSQQPEQAKEIQKRISGAFVEYFEKGLAVIGFERSETAGVYLLGHNSEGASMQET